MDNNKTTPSEQSLPFGKQDLVEQFNVNNSEVDLTEVFKVIWAGKIKIILIVFVFSVLSIFFALSKPDIYKANSLLSPAQGDNGASGLAGLAGQFGGLASIAGLSLGGPQQNNTLIAIESLKSRVFLESFITKHKMKVPLLAANGWNEKTNELSIDEQKYNVNSREWIREVSYPKEVVPSSWEAYEQFKKHLSIDQDQETGMLSISIKFYSPNIAKKWLTEIIKELNEYMRKKDQVEAQGSIDFLTGKLEETQNSGMQTVFYQLIEEQTKKVMLTEVAEEYVFKIIEPPNVPDLRDSPNRILICILGFLFGGVFSVIFVIIQFYTKKNCND